MRKLLLPGSFILAIFIFAVPVAHADVNDFVINKLDVNYALDSTDRQGHMSVRETFDLEFKDQNRGILRALPDRYKGHRLQLDVANIKVDGEAARWSTYGSNGNTVLKIGDPGRTLTGFHRYEINYSMNNVVSFYPAHDELYWDVNGDQWGQRFENVSAKLQLPRDAELIDQKLICYTGSFGSREHACEISYDDYSHAVVATTTRTLEPYETLSIVLGFNKGYFQSSSWFDTASEYFATAFKFLTPILLLGGTAWWHWRRFGRDPKGRQVIVPHYEAPNKLKAIEAGTIADFRTDNSDITATIIDLAIRGYVKIIEVTNVRKLRKDTKTFNLQLEETNFVKLDDTEAKLLGAIFSKREKGEVVDLAELKFKLSTTAAEIRKNLNTRLSDGGYFRKTPLSVTLKFTALLILEAVVIVIAAAANDSPAIIWGGIIGGIVALVFILFMPSRTPKGVEAKEAILGLKMYLEVAESERIKKLQTPDAPYAQKTTESKKTVELFERLLPYAIVLGVEKQWADKFKGIYKSPPDWYGGNISTFNAAYLATSLGGVSSSVNTAFSSPSSSSGSGSSGGAGGGGGGGGGGGW